MIHYFTSSREAYDATMCGEHFETDAEIKTGDILVIESEGVIGVADTWPIALTPECGSLHKPTDSSPKGLIDQLKQITMPADEVLGVYEAARESQCADEGEMSI